MISPAPSMFGSVTASPKTKRLMTSVVTQLSEFIP